MVGGLPAKPGIASMTAEALAERARAAIHEMGGRWLLLGPDCTEEEPCEDPPHVDVAYPTPRTYPFATTSDAGRFVGWRDGEGTIRGHLREGRERLTRLIPVGSTRVSPSEGRWAGQVLNRALMRWTSLRARYGFTSLRRFEDGV